MSRGRRRGGGPPLTRRHLVATALVVGASAACALAGCSGGEPPSEVPPPSPVQEIGVETTAPSGEVSAVLDTAGDELGVLLRDAEGEDIWADDYLYDVGAPPLLVWESGADVLWVLAPDGGAVRIAEKGEGVWVQESGAAPPTEIGNLR
jgi:hypothetical protein